MELKIDKRKHPNKKAEQKFNQLIGIDDEKEKLVSGLINLLDDTKLNKWLSENHNNELPILKHILSGTPLIILEGDVGCGKTALAQSVATNIAKEIEKKIEVFETPTNIRGGGMVGGISDRISGVFEYAKRNLKDQELGILIIDEADDLVTSREQNQAHHEDRAGVNVLIKEIDAIKRDNLKIVIIMITNRVNVIDPAIRRRCSLHLTFNRPKNKSLKQLIKYILTDVDFNDKDVDSLVRDLSSRDILFSSSDLIHRVAKEAIEESIRLNLPFGFDVFKKSLELIQPSPILKL